MSLHQKLSICLVLASCTLVSLSSVAAEQSSQQHQIEQRIKPIGQVHLSEAEPTQATEASTTTAAPETKTTAMTGEDVYKKHCTVCHDTGAGGASKIGETDKWQGRFDNAKNRPGGLLQSVKNGLNAMPAKGMCMTCSDEELQNAVNYILDKSSVKRG